MSDLRTLIARWRDDSGATDRSWPDNREDEVRAQVQRPAFRGVSDLRVRYLPYGELSRHRDTMARFGEGLKAIQAVSRVLA